MHTIQAQEGVGGLEEAAGWNTANRQKEGRSWRDLSHA